MRHGRAGTEGTGKCTGGQARGHTCEEASTQARAPIKHQDVRGGGALAKPSCLVRVAVPQRSWRACQGLRCQREKRQGRGDWVYECPGLALPLQNWGGALLQRKACTARLPLTSEHTCVAHSVKLSSQERETCCGVV